MGLTVFLTPKAVAQESTPCDEALERTETAYIEGRFSQAISLLSPCLDRAGTEQENLVRAYRFLTLAFLRSDNIAEARAAVIRLLSIAPDYQTDPVYDLPSYRALVDVVRQQVQGDAASAAENLPAAAGEQEEENPSWLRSHLTWIVSGGALITAGVLAAVLSGGGSESPPSLPGPPSMPH